MTRQTKIFLTALGLATLGACLKFPIGERIACILSPEAPADVRWLNGTGDGTIALAYQLIPGELLYDYWKLRKRPTVEMFAQFAAFILLCGATHGANILRFWYPLEYAFGILKHITGAVSLSVWWTLRKHRSEILGFGDYEVRMQAKEGELLEALGRERAATAKAGEALEREVLARAESDRLAFERASQLAVLESRDRTIQELTSPILHVRPGVLLVPLVGIVDSTRASELQERLGLLCERQAARVILDLTGVDAIDTAVAAHLHGMTRFVQYLGGQCIVTGMRAAVAQALVGLGIDLQIRTYNTLADGIAAATRQT